MKFVYSKDLDDLGGQSIDVTVSIRPETENKVVFEKKIHAESAPCSWIATAEWEFTPKETNYRMYLNIRENGENDGNASYTGFSAISKIKDTSPLNQFKSGISFDQIYCKENLMLVQKHDGTPACVKPETKEKLKQRDWLKRQFSFCGAEGFDSKGNLNKTNSTHQWDENECQWSKISHLSNEKNVHSLPFGITQEDLENEIIINPIYTKDPNNHEERILNVDAMTQVKKIMDKCNYSQKLRSGEIPAQNPDGSYNAITGEFQFYQNGTHYIDSNNCKWIDSLETLTYNCFEAKPTEPNWYVGPDYFANSTHYIDAQECHWFFLSEDYWDLPICDSIPEHDFGKCREVP